MPIETLRDILGWSRRFHEQLSSCLAHCAGENKNRRATLVLEYLAQHEQALAHVIHGFEDLSDEGALNTWCTNYLERHEPLLRHGLHCNEPFADMTADDIVASVEKQHAKIIDLYRYLASKVESSPASVLVGQLLKCEENEAKLMSHNANRFQDL